MDHDQIFWPQEIVLDRTAYLLCWESAKDDDSLDTIVAHDGHLVVGRDISDLLRRLAEAGHRPERAVTDEDFPRCIDFDHVRRAVEREPAEASYSSVLDAWNLLDDALLASGKPLRFQGRLAETAYDKLFWGLNLPSLTPEGEEYHPTWRRKEWRKVRQLMIRGTSRLRRLLQDSEAFSR